MSNGPYRTKEEVIQRCQSGNCITPAKYFYPAFGDFKAFYLCDRCATRYELANAFTGQNVEFKELYPSKPKSFLSKLWSKIKSLVYKNDAN